jgi:hypothetical protein
MSAIYRKNEGSLEAYYTRVIGAICKQNGGEFRVKGEFVDSAAEVGKFVMGWDHKTQEVVFRTDLSFAQVIVVMPQAQPGNEVVAADPLKKEPEQPTLFSGKGSTLDDEKLQKLERELTKRRVASMISEDLRKRQRQPEV